MDIATRTRGRATRTRLLQAAEDLFAKRGYDATTIADVARRAGVGVGTVYYHFSDKKTLLLNLIEDRGDSLTPRNREDFDLARLLDGDLRAEIHRSIRRSYEALGKKPSLYLVVLALAQRDPDVRRCYQRAARLDIVRLSDFIELGQRRGVIHSDIDPRTAAFVLHQTMDTLVTRMLVWELSEPDPEVLVRELSHMTCRYLLKEGS